MHRTWMTLGAVLLLSAAPQEDAREEKKGKEDPCLVALGGMSLSCVSLMYLSISVLGDGFEKQVYPGKQVRKLMGDITGLAETNRKDLKKLVDAGPTDDGRKALERVIESLARLKKLVDALTAYTKDPTKENAEAFQKARKAAEAKIREITGK